MTDTGRITRDELGLVLAATWARRGTCGRRQVGCVLLDVNGYQIGSGYNGPAAGERHCTAGAPCPGFGAASGTDLDLCEAVHAEINALVRCERVYDLLTCYVTVSPCSSCVKALLNTPCRRIVFAEEYAVAQTTLARERWLRDSAVKLRVGAREWIHLPLPKPIRYTSSRGDHG
jgi:dCMP deaminase